jgi:hypothetical protein
MKPKLDRLAFELSKLFAQYEYALKAMGYGRAGRGGQAEPDGDRFANEVGCHVMLLDDRLIAGARQYLFDQPPKRQVWVEGSVQWEEMTGSGAAQLRRDGFHRRPLRRMLRRMLLDHPHGPLFQLG